MAMNFRSLVLGLGIGVAAAPLVLGADTYAYTATTVAKPNKQGVVTASSIQWNCTASGCTTKGPWPVPGVGACKALAQQVGAVKAYGHPGRQLSAADLARCNEGLNANASMSVQQPKVTAVAPSTSAAGKPAPAGVKPAPAAGPSITGTSGLNNLQLRNGIRLRAENFANLQRARETAAADARRRQEEEVERRRAASTVRGNDCDDLRADIHPGAAELCDGRDNDCDGAVDEEQTQRRYLDADGDGHGDPARAVDACPMDITNYARSAEAGSGGWLVEIGNDCDDTNPDIWRGCR
jgi:hypothetical protein